MDAIRLSFLYTNLPKMFHVLLNGTYHEKHLLANVIHERLGPGPLPARGGLTIRTPLSQLLSLDSSYNATSEDNNLQVGAMLDHNNKHKVNVIYGTI